MNCGLSPSDQDLIRKTFSEFPQVNEAILFGSRALGNFKETSDVDLALKGNLSLSDVSRIKARLEEGLPLPYFFDLVAYGLIDHPDLKAHIDTFGRSFYFKKSE